MVIIQFGQCFKNTGRRDYHFKQIEGDAMNREAILAVLPDSKDNAKSLKDLDGSLRILG
jgi:hypothetical protein